MKRVTILSIIIMMFCNSTAFSLKVISSNVLNISENAAKVVIKIDEEHDAQIKYGSDPSQLNKVYFSMMKSKQHEFYLTNLERGQDYYYQLVINLDEGKTFQSRIENFRAKGIPKPQVTGFRVAEKSIEGGTLLFTTNTPCYHEFNCGMDKTLGYRGSSDKLSLSHQIVITNFLPLTKIYFSVLFTNETGETTVYEGDFTSGEHNVAIGKKVTGTFTIEKFDNYILDTPPMLSRITDGTLDYFKGMATSGDPKNADQWVKIDLGDIFTLDKILTFWRGTAYPNQFSLLVSLDGKAWKTISDDLDAGRGEISRSESGDPMMIVTTDAEKSMARFVKLFIQKGARCYQKHRNFHFVQLFEIKVYPAETYSFRTPKQ